MLNRLKILIVFIFVLGFTVESNAQSFLSCTKPPINEYKSYHWGAICNWIPQANWNECANLLLQELRHIDPALADAALQIRVVDQTDANALLFNNSVIVLTQGLLDKLKSRGELIFVVAHELGHYLINRNTKSVSALRGPENDAEMEADAYALWISRYFPQTIANPLNLFDQVISGDLKATHRSQRNLAVRRNKLAILTAYDRTI